MTAEPYEFSFDFLKQAARRIVNEVVGVSRVTYDITSKPPGMCNRPDSDISFTNTRTGTIELE